MDKVLRVYELNSADLEQERWEWGRRWSEVGLERGRWDLREVKRGLGDVEGRGFGKVEVGFEGGGGKGVWDGGGGG